MTARQSRLDIIKAIIQEQEIGSQDELLAVLASRGLTLTQATLSRDLKLLRVVKGNREVGTAVQNGFMRIRYTGNLAVIKTRPGYASGLASDIDNANFEEVIGTIAGDETIMMALEEGFNKDILEANLRTIIPVYPGSRM